MGTSFVDFAVGFISGAAVVSLTSWFAYVVTH